LYDEIDDDGVVGAASPAAEPVRTEGGRAAFWGAPRAPMTLAISDDAGLTWPMRRNIEIGDGYCLSNNSRDGLNREFSYPTITTWHGRLHIAFTRFRQAIEYVEVSTDWIRGS
jgi:predicted neuraminidase